ncbi:potassium-transporting ATPase subunit KdpC [Aureimonas phyllosphaerae]|uniref:Potassium-transporting ATPase KdpC subunit n=1 Tax=Aureimonas phyllosphaerae TaxID=1166078 RepID=A0A7W6BVP4_9HYPH|nr:potassium-transporting ATPase subunit KdpC [Aureimonas phyllosphaerae]MBB3937175.1 K+-transporting ATPase ATPase C chain [Aureimonas phyllosphaerae]MBB3961188.1 K+-transporting ATPase ATPase C chain [Aureimonas phyllosphaerae]SFF48624.1 K+-transporting ATPase ATPase C chain [Aureimonas phyllosphaerae]
MLSQLRAAATLLGLLTLLLGVAYPLAMTAVAGAVFPAQASGSLVDRDGRPVGSSLIGQAFTDARYLQGRPSAAGTGYDASSSSGTNLGPTSAKLAERLKTDGEAMKAATGASVLPADAVTTSGSGLDPDVSPAFAELQVARIAGARSVDADLVRRAIADNTAGRTLLVLGEPRVNVLAVNLALDALAPATTTPAPTPTASADRPAG